MSTRDNAVSDGADDTIEQITADPSAHYEPFDQQAQLARSWNLLV